MANTINTLGDLSDRDQERVRGDLEAYWRAKGGQGAAPVLAQLLRYYKQEQLKLSDEESRNTTINPAMMTALKSEPTSAKEPYEFERTPAEPAPSSAPKAEQPGAAATHPAKPAAPAAPAAEPSKPAAATPVEAPKPAAAAEPAKPQPGKPVAHPAPPKRPAHLGASAPDSTDLLPPKKGEKPPETRERHTENGLRALGVTNGQMSAAESKAARDAYAKAAGLGEKYTPDQLAAQVKKDVTEIQTKLGADPGTYNLGKFGPKKDGVDGVAGSYTAGAARRYAAEHGGKPPLSLIRPEQPAPAASAEPAAPSPADRPGPSPLLADPSKTPGGTLREAAGISPKPEPLLLGDKRVFDEKMRAVHERNETDKAINAAVGPIDAPGKLSSDLTPARATNPTASNGGGTNGGGESNPHAATEPSRSYLHTALQAAQRVGGVLSNAGTVAGEQIGTAFGHVGSVAAAGVGKLSEAAGKAIEKGTADLSPPTPTPAEKLIQQAKQTTSEMERAIAGHPEMSRYPVQEAGTEPVTPNGQGSKPQQQQVATRQ